MRNEQLDGLAPEVLGEPGQQLSMAVELESGPSVIEQVAYYSEEEGQITHMRLVCSGFRPVVGG